MVSSETDYCIVKSLSAFEQRIKTSSKNNSEANQPIFLFKVDEQPVSRLIELSDSGHRKFLSSSIDLFREIEGVLRYYPVEFYWLQPGALNFQEEAFNFLLPKLKSWHGLQSYKDAEQLNQACVSLTIQLPVWLEATWFF